MTYDRFVPEEERLREALCTLGNGYFATRGAGSEARADTIHYPGTYLAGGYNRLVTEIAGRAIENEDLVNLPNWLPISFRINEGEWFSLSAVEIFQFTQELDLKHGLLRRRVRFKDAHGRVCRLREHRLVHMGDQHLAAIHWELAAEDWEGQVEIRSALDGTVKNDGVRRYRDLASNHLEPLEQGAVDAHTNWLKVRTVQSDIRVAVAARTKAWQGERAVTQLAQVEEETGWIAHKLTLDLVPQVPITVEKVVSLYTSKDFAITECGLEAQQTALRAPDFVSLQTTQRQQWKMLWEQCDIEVLTEVINHRRNPLLILRLHIFHLLQTASPNTIDLDVGIPARGWHGEAYRGHVFWDELFIFPMLNLRMPKITSALLKYRIRRLSQARRAANDQGFVGALYPWQSGSNGREETQRLHLNPRSGRWLPDHTHLQRHVAGAIAYNLWGHFQVSRDIDFLLTQGAEVILEIARFFVGLATFNQQLERYEILGVMGPDEYHDSYPWSADTPGIHNNAYTNLLAVWVVSRALEMLQMLPLVHADQLRRQLAISDQELTLWEDVTRRMRLVFHDGDILSQFEGYEKLQEFPWEQYLENYGDIQRLDRILEAEGDSANRYQVSKQADVLMLFYLFTAEELADLFERLNYSFDPDMIQRNICYYMQRTAHGSTLSRVVHAWVLARADRPASWRLFLDALQSDVDDIQGGTTAEGIHLGAMAGTVDIIQRGYAGISFTEEALRFNPCLPDPVSSIRFTLCYRGHALVVSIQSGRLHISVKEGSAPPIRICVGTAEHFLGPGESLEIAL